MRPGTAPRKVAPDLRYRAGARVRFVAHDVLAGISFLRRGRPGKAFAVLADFFRLGVREGVLTWKDPAPGLRYLFGRIMPRSAERRDSQVL